MLFSEVSSNDCSAQIRTCNDGVLSGDNAYNKAYCRLSAATPTGTSCQVSWNGSTVMVPHNSRLIGFVSEKASTETGGPCSLASARCNSGALVGNANVVSSCREKRIEEMPDGSLMTGHAFNNSKVSISYRVSAQSAGTSCSLEYRKNGAWYEIPANLLGGFSCAGLSAGSILKVTLDLSLVPSFNWTETINATGAAEYKTKIRIKYNSATEPLRELICIKRGADISGATADVDENCDGIF
jgi:hypothetical protein